MPAARRSRRRTCPKASCGVGNGVPDIWGNFAERVTLSLPDIWGNWVTDACSGNHLKDWFGAQGREKQVNASQKLVLKICACIICAMLFYPPYEFKGLGLGYHLLFVGPEHEFATINAGQLLIQWVGVCLIGGIAYALAKNTAPDLDGYLNAPGVKSTLRIAIALIRVLRALLLIFVVFAGLGFAGGLLSMATMDPSEDFGKAAAFLLVKFISIVVLVGVALGLRLLINRMHSARTGASAPLLAGWRSL